VLVTSYPLSSSVSPQLSSSLGGVIFKQFRRTYPGNYTINFSNCLSSTNDFSVKNYSNFYLTDKYKLSEVLEQPLSEIKSKYIFGPLILGGNLLTFSDIDLSDSTSYQYKKKYDYGSPIFTTIETPETKLTLQILDNNKCHIYYTKNYKKYYLCCDSNIEAVFCKESLLSFDTTTTNPQDLIYWYSDASQSIVLFKTIGSGTYIFRKIGNVLKLTPVIDNDSYTYVSNAFKISKKIHIPFNSIINTSIISYNEDNTINNGKSVFDLSNNLLLHKKYSYNTPTDIIVLKNQLTQNDIFSTSNTLLTGINVASFSDEFREYTSIGKDINSEKTEDVELNYVIYNKSYTIRSGSNIFTSPSSLYPYDAININDTKFVESGAFSYITPEYADKVYHLSNNVKNYDNGQYLLYTWLSGASNSSEKIWVDRYYYPDLIAKSDALLGKNIFNSTYDNALEQIIKNNSDISNNLEIIKVFDKTSDLAFYPNQQYRYDRISPSSIPQLQSSFTYCNSYSNIYPYNYFKIINDSGEMSLGFDFIGDENDWIIRSGRNDVDSGIYIEKSGNNITMKFQIYDATNEFYDGSSNSWIYHEISLPIKSLKSNYLFFSINSKTGVGYFFLNDKIVYNFQIDPYQFTTKQLLYGDIFLHINDIKTNILSDSVSNIQNVFISEYYIESDLAFIIKFINGEIKIDNIELSLPCGMINSSDYIDSIHAICGSSAFKSNYVDIHVKNLNIDNTSILKGLQESIGTLTSDIFPTNTKLNVIEFKNFK